MRILIMMMLISSGVANECYGGWHVFGMKCFLFNATSVPMKENHENCRKLNGSMVSIHGAEENEALRRLVFNLYESPSLPWIGGEQILPRTLYYKWLDGTPLRYINWAPNEPDCDPKAACCGMMLGPKGTWFDFPCNLPFPQLCQKFLEPPPSDKSAPNNFVDRVELRLRNLEKAMGTNKLEPQPKHDPPPPSPSPPDDILGQMRHYLEDNCLLIVALCALLVLFLGLTHVILCSYFGKKYTEIQDQVRLLRKSVIY